MSQSDFGNLSSPLSGADLVDNNLEPWRDALHSLHSGSSRPSYAVAGMAWIDNSGTPWELNIFDGTNDVTIALINETTHELERVTIRDNEVLVENNADDTKKVILDASALTTATTRTLSAQDASYIIAGKNIAQSYSGAQNSAITSLTSTSNSIAINLALNNNFSHTLTENTTLANPSNKTSGQSGNIYFTQGAGTARTLAFGSDWKEATTGSAPTAPTTLSADFTLSYTVHPSGNIFYVMNKRGVS